MLLNWISSLSDNAGRFSKLLKIHYIVNVYHLPFSILATLRVDMFVSFFANKVSQISFVSDQQLRGAFKKFVDWQLTTR